MLVYSTAMGEAMPPAPTILETARETTGGMGVLATGPAPSNNALPGSSAPSFMDRVLGNWMNQVWLLIPGAAATILFLEVRRRRLTSKAEAPALGGATVRVARESAVPPASP